MSWKDCAASIRAAAGRDLTDDQVADIFEAVDRRRKAIEATGKVDGLDQRVTQAALEAADAVRIEAALTKKHAALSAIARDRVARRNDALLDDPGMNGGRLRNLYSAVVLQNFEGTTRGITGGRKSVAATKLAYEARFVGGMMADIAREVPHAERMLRDRAFLDDVVREMTETREGGTPGRTGNRDAQKVAAIFTARAEESRVELNRLGANIGKLDGWAGAQIHDATKIARMEPGAWVDAILPKLDLERTFPGLTGPETDRALRNVWENIVFQPERGGPSETPSGIKMPFNVARALERHRVLHFKSADDWLAYSREFGSGHIFDGMIAHQSRAALNAAQMEWGGPNPGATLEAELERLRRKVDRDERIPPSQKARVKDSLQNNYATSIGSAFRIASGASMIPHNDRLADVAGSVRAVQSMAKLGGAVISSLSDLVSAVVNLRFNGLSFGEAVGGQVTEFLRGRGKGEAREIAYLLGEGFDGIIGHIISPYVAADSAPGAMQAELTRFFRWTGLPLWTDAQRAGVARVLAAHLGKQSGKAWDALPERLRNVMNTHGIDAVMWDTIRANTREIDGRKYVVPGIPDRDADLALRRYYADEAQSSILEADAATTRFVTWGTQRGTGYGEAVRFLMQFKAFPVAFSTRVLGRAIQGGEGGTYAGAAHIGTLLVGMTVMGYASMTAKDALRGYEPRDPQRPETILAALAQGGAAGIYGDFLFGAVNRSRNNIAETALGPTFGEAFGILRELQLARDGEATAGDAVRRIMSNTPYINLWWARPALDYLFINELREWATPGSLARADANRRKEYGQEALIAPSDRILDLF